MNNAGNRHVRELIEAINAAVAQDPGVQACRERARSAGFELNVSVEVVVNSVERGRPAAARAVDQAFPGGRRQLPAARTYEMTAADRRFLRSLRIAAAEEP
jgi:hypothetical protein